MSTRGDGDGGSTPDEPARPRELVSDDFNTVGFLDAPTSEPDELAAAIADAFELLDGGAVLTVYLGDPESGSDLAMVCDDHGIDLIAAIPHASGGTTFTLRMR